MGNAIVPRIYQTFLVFNFPGKENERWKISLPEKVLGGISFDRHELKKVVTPKADKTEISYEPAGINFDIWLTHLTQAISKIQGAFIEKI